MRSASFLFETNEDLLLDNFLYFQKILIMKVTIESNYTNRIKAILENKETVIYDNSNELCKILKRGLLYPKTLCKNKILFIGINPSFREAHDYPHGFNNFHFENEIIETPSEDRYSYFKIFDKICSSDEWTHFDIFPFREKNQSKLTDLINQPFFKDFLKSFALFSKEIIVESRPKIIVVSNAYLRRFFSQENESSNANEFSLFKTHFSNEIGTHVIDENSLKNTPVFFTSMLSGQRAMDVGSRERLEWHIKKLTS